MSSEPQPPYHPHSAYLQVWYELGILGAGLFLGFGLAVIRWITRLRPEIQPFALAQFSMTAVTMTTAFGLWQFWFLSAIALGVVGLFLVEIVVKRQHAEIQAEAGGVNSPNMGPYHPGESTERC